MAAPTAIPAKPILIKILKFSFNYVARLLNDYLITSVIGVSMTRVSPYLENRPFETL